MENTNFKKYFAQMAKQHLYSKDFACGVFFLHPFICRINTENMYLKNLLIAKQI